MEANLCRLRKLINIRIPLKDIKTELEITDKKFLANIKEKKMENNSARINKRKNRRKKSNGSQNRIKERKLRLWK